MTRDRVTRSRAMKEKIRRQNRPNELKARDRERNRISTQKRRMNESLDEKEARREKQKIMQRIARMNESEEARALRLETGRIRAKFRRLTENYEQRRMRLEKERLNARMKRMMETPEQKEERRKRDSLRQKEKRQKIKRGELLPNKRTYEENSTELREVFGKTMLEVLPQEHQKNIKIDESDRVPSHFSKHHGFHLYKVDGKATLQITQADRSLLIDQLISATKS